MKKLIIPLAMIVGLSIGCKTKEVKPSLLEPIVMSSVPIQSLTKENGLVEKVENILKENHVEYIENVFIYEGQGRRDFLEEIQKRFDYNDLQLKQSYNLFEKTKNNYAVLLFIPDEKVGTGAKSIMCIFPGITEFLENDVDLRSMVLDYSWKKAEINANGFELNGQKISLKSPGMNNLLWERLIELESRVYQIDKKIELNLEISNKYKKAIFNTCRLNCLQLSALAKRHNKYAFDALKQAEKYLQSLDENK